MFKTIMLRYCLLILFYNIFLSYSLLPKKMPNGKSRKFIANKNNPHEDLKLITPQKAKLICTNWMENIILSVKNNKKNIKNNFVYDDLHIVTNINKMNIEIQKNITNKSKIYLSWEPNSLQGIKETLFIVVINIEIENKIMKIDNIIQSPFWDNKQIESIFLKKSLVSQNRLNNITEIDFNNLYKDNIRYKLSWEDWYL